ncbi:hypothetical protein J6590_039622 [Homalodisca vitripennis]|nr:hypothetical protein J6590_039622 [Homalodisca vitripennis]
MRGRLQQIDFRNPPNPESRSVLIAGANDIAAGDNSSIFELLEQRTTARFNSVCVVSTVPHCPDLSPDHPVNQHTALANSFIKVLRWFTCRGMYLRIPSKRILAELLFGRLMKAEQDEEVGKPTEQGTAFT